MKNKTNIALALTLTVLLAGCGLNKSAELASKSLSDQMETTKRIVNSEVSEFNKNMSDPKFKKEYGHYAKQANWENKLSEAQTRIKAQTEWYENKFQPLVKANKRKSSSRVVNMSRMAKRELHEISMAARIVDEDIKRIDEAKEKSKRYTNFAKDAVDKATDKMDYLSKQRDMYIEKYSDQEPKIDAKYEKVDSIYRSILVAKSKMVKEVESSTPNWLTVANQYEHEQKYIGDFNKAHKEVSEDYSALDESYTLILNDMKIEYFVTVGVSSWDNDSDYNTETVTYYKDIPVSEESYVELTRNGGTIATYSHGWGGDKITPNVSSSTWRDLSIRSRAGFEDRDDAAEYWVEDFYPVYYHKYTEINGEDSKQSDWEEVDEALFASSMNALGMSIESKPYGTFPDDAVIQAHPPAMAFVGNPKYGEFREDKSGNSFWHYYGQYAFISAMIGPDYHYSRGMYNDWYDRRHTSAYYGGTRTSPAFGTQSNRVRTSPTLAKSTWVKSGRVSSPPRTVRASSKRVGGGPSGRGK